VPKARYLKVEISGAIAVASLDRGETMNALDDVLIGELTAAVGELSADPALRILVLASTHPKAFVAGADIKAMAGQSAWEKTRFVERGHALMATIENSPLVTVAAVNGFALGGGFELALACDLIAVGPRAIFGLPEVTLGLVPGFGGTQRFARSVGTHRALRYVLTAERFSADTAEAMGLVWKRFDSESESDFLTNVLEALADLARLSPVALRTAKRLVRAAHDVDLASGSAMEIGLFGAVGGSQDAAEGLAAFIGKRKPEFRGV
jgi:enoyl-CoA hydratase